MTRAELLELLKKARKQLKKYHVPKDEQTVTLSIDTLETALSEQPDIVRCKDCRYAEHTMFDNEYNCYFDEENESGCKRCHKGEWFCANGEAGQ